MKRHKNLYARICSFENLLLAAERAARGKRRRAGPARFSLRLEEHLLALQDALLARSYSPGPYREFYVQDGKRRWISAAPFPDRVVHHALCNVIEPIFDATFVRDSYACRKGKGTHAAADRAQQAARRYSHVLQADISQYFASIDHERLRRLLARKIGCPDTLWLIDVVLAAEGGLSAPPQYFPGDTLFEPFERRRGIPLGNLTSQFFGNVYLSPLDHFIKEPLGVQAYVRYVDDLLLFSDGKPQLHQWRAAVERKLWELRLELHPRKCRIYPVQEGIDFVGYRIFPTHRRLRPSNGYRFRRRLKHMAADFRARKVSLEKVSASVHGWVGHARHADTWGLRSAIFAETALRAPQEGG